MTPPAVRSPATKQLSLAPTATLPPHHAALRMLPPAAPQLHGAPRPRSTLGRLQREIRPRSLAPIAPTLAHPHLPLPPPSPASHAHHLRPSLRGRRPRSKWQETKIWTRLGCRFGLPSFYHPHMYRINIITIISHVSPHLREVQPPPGRRTRSRCQEDKIWTCSGCRCIQSQYMPPFPHVQYHQYLVSPTYLPSPKSAQPSPFGLQVRSSIQRSFILRVSPSHLPKYISNFLPSISPASHHDLPRIPTVCPMHRSQYLLTPRLRQTTVFVTVWWPH